MKTVPRRRKKEPQALRRRLLDAAARLAVQSGPAAVTIQAVASAAGVTKGGLAHHFPSKHELLLAMFSDLMGMLDAQIDARMGRDSARYGRFTRAYIATLLTDQTTGVGSPFDGLVIATLSDPALGAVWDKWIAGRLERHRDTDGDPTLEIVRFAADGAWLAHAGKAGVGLTALQERLLQMTTGTT